MPASRSFVRGKASASATGACHASTEVTGLGSLSR